MEGQMADYEVDLRSGRVYTVPFYVLPDVNLLFQPINGPEHNFKVSETLRILKRKRPTRMVTDESALELDDDGRRDGKTDTDDETVCRREWLADLVAIETRLAEELRRELEQTQAAEYR